MKTWKIPVSWQMCGCVNVEANTLEEAMDIAENDPEIEIPDGEYVDSSWELSLYDEDTIRLIWNDNQVDEVD